MDDLTQTQSNISSPNVYQPQNTGDVTTNKPVSTLLTGNVGFRRKSKSVDTSKFSNLASNVKNATSGQTSQNYYTPNSSNIIQNPTIQSLGTITTPYGSSTKIEQSHTGVDIANKPGTAIPNLSEGTVVDVQSGYGQNKQFTKDKSAWGNSVVIRDKNGNYWRYSHLLDTYVKTGQQIAKGQQIGQMGNTGNTYSTNGGTGTHLDLRLWKLINGQKQYINPLTYQG